MGHGLMAFTRSPARRTAIKLPIPITAKPLAGSVT